jgi:hypothetical protein
MEIDTNETEAIMSDITTPRYGYAPQVMFAATRAGAERRARETAVTTAADRRHSRSTQSLISSFVARLARSTS